MSEDKKLSVIIPVFRTEEYLDRCVSSVLEQTYKNLEVILVDDGSDDNCPQMCDAYASKDSRVKVIHKENGGLSDARNTGYAEATGDYITFMDSDDYADPDMYEYMLADIGDSQTVICGMRRFGRENTEFPNYSEKTVLSGDEAAKELFCDGKIKNYVGNKVYHRSVTEGVQFPKGLNFEDIATVYKYLMKSEKVTVLPGYRFNYFIREGSISHSLSVKNLYHRFKAHMLRYEDVKDVYPESKEELLRQMMFSARALALGILKEDSFEENGDILSEMTAFYRENKTETENVSLFNKYELKQIKCLERGKKEDFKKLKNTDFLRKVNKLMKG